MKETDDIQPMQYWTQQMEAGFAFMERMRQYPVEECGERLVSLPEAAAAAHVEVEFSDLRFVNQFDRIHRLRSGLVEGFIAIARDMNDRGWVLRVEDGYRTRQMQKALCHTPYVFDAIVQMTVRELGGKIPTPGFLGRRVAALVASRPRVGTHMSGSALDISVLTRDDRSRIDRGGFYPEISERTPMSSPFLSVEARHNRFEITGIMERHGFMAYPYEFWHYSKGDTYAEYLSNSGKPARYGAVDWNATGNTVGPIPHPDDPLNSDAEIQLGIEQALKRMRKPI